MDSRQLADIRAGTAGSCLRSGSGYRIGPTLILTALHNLLDGAAPLPRIEVRLGHPAEGTPTRHAATLVWTAPGGQDVALLRMTDAPSFGPGVRWGRLSGAEPVRYTGLGFPGFAEYDAGERGVEQLGGVLYPLSTGHRGCFPIEQSVFPDPGVAHSWAGVSGAAVFSDGRDPSGGPSESCSGGRSGGWLLVGVATFGDAGFGNRRLHATPVGAFFHDQTFARLLADDIGAEAALESAHLHTLFRHEGRDPRAGTPGSLLAASRESVAFQGRRSALAELAAWRDGPRRLSLKLIVGEGGQGKTRLARQSIRLTPPDWVAGFLASPRDRTAGPVGGWADDPDHERMNGVVGRLRTGRHSTLIVVDYAESVPDRVGRLIASLVEDPPQRPVRLLLLARSERSWWDNLRAQLERDFPEALTPPVRLPPLADTLDQRYGEYARAVSRFSELMPGFAELRDQAWPELAHYAHVAAPDLSDQAFGNVLTLHMTALSALLRAAMGQDPSLVVDPELELLAHERDYLRRVASRRRLLEALSSRLDPDSRRMDSQQALDRALAGAILLGPCDEERALAVASLAAEPGRHAIGGVDVAVANLAAGAGGVEPAGVPWPYTRDVADWLAALYPPTDHDRATGTVIAAVQPDRLAERLAGQILTEQADTFSPDGALKQPGALTRIAPLAHDLGTAQGLVTILARAATRPAFSQVLDGQLEHLIAAHSERYATAAQLAATAVDRHAPIVNGLVTLGRLDPERLTEQVGVIADGLPQHSLSLAWHTVAITDLHSRVYRKLAEADPGAWSPYLALSLNNLSLRLSETGRHDEGLTAAREATAIYRSLTGASPETWLSFLASSLNVLSNGLAQVGRREEALAISYEATGVSRSLARAEPDTRLPELATSLHNLSLRLAETGQRESSLPVVQEAITIHRELAGNNPGAWLPDLAMSLSNLSVRLGEVNRLDESLTAVREATAIYRTLAEAHPDTWRADCARCLSLTGRVLLVSGRAADAVEPLLHAIGLDRQLHDNAQGSVSRLTGESAAVLHRAYLEDAEGVGAAFRAITGGDIPTWITHPPTDRANDR